MTPPDLLTGELTLHGRVMPASNATFVGEIDGRRVVYKPVAGERPLWDFPDGTLAQREEAAYVVSEALGWDVVPLTWRRDLKEMYALHVDVPNHFAFSLTVGPRSSGQTGQGSGLLPSRRSRFGSSWLIVEKSFPTA